MDKLLKEIISDFDEINSSIKEDFRKSLFEATIQPPIDGSLVVTSQFGVQRPDEIHPGVDLRAKSGTPVKAIMDGEVVNVTPNKKCGGTIDIDYKNGYWSRYCHIKKVEVSKGQIVKQGQIVGLSGGASDDPGKGNSGAAHLHFTLKLNGKHVNPMNYINKAVDSPEIIPSQAPQDDSDVEDDSGDYDSDFGGYGYEYTPGGVKKDKFLTGLGTEIGKILDLDRIKSLFSMK